MRQVKVENSERRRREFEREAQTTGRTWPEMDMGPPVTLWRRFRDGHETTEILPRWIARLTLRAIPYNEPEVERASLKE